MTASEFLGSRSRQFPQPSRPLHACDTSIVSMEAEDRFPDQYFHNLAENSTFESEEQNRLINESEHDYQILRGFLEELHEEGQTIFKKLVSKVKKEVPFERLFRETLHDFQGSPVLEVLEKFLTKLNSTSANDQTNMERGINIDDLLTASHQDIEEPKLERFKVKTVNVVGIGVVKEEQQ